MFVTLIVTPIRFKIIRTVLCLERLGNEVSNELVGLVRNKKKNRKKTEKKPIVLIFLGNPLHTYEIMWHFGFRLAVEKANADVSVQRTSL